MQRIRPLTPSPSNPLRHHTAPWLALVAALLSGCQGGLARIDRDVTRLLATESRGLGPADEAPPARHQQGGGSPDPARPNSERPETVNPAASEIRIVPASAAERDVPGVVARLAEEPGNTGEPIALDLPAALTYAIEHGREYRFAEESYVLAALNLLIEEHRWGPRFFNETSAVISGGAEGGTWDSALDLVNEFQVTHRLPYGGDVSVRALVSAVEDLHQRVSGENTQAASLVVDASIPLMRGAGLVAREDLIQRRRDLVYAAREFEDFRRSYLVDIASTFLDLVASQSSISNARRNVDNLAELERRQVALYQAGRQPQFEAALASNATVRARDNLNLQVDRFRRAVDLFKVQLGMPVERPLTIVDSTLGLPVPLVDVVEAVSAGLVFRLDLQTERDRLDDAARAVSIARNQLLPDLDLSGSFTLPTDPAHDRAGLDLDADSASFAAGATLSWPLDRRIEELDLRRAQIGLERAAREYQRSRDSIAAEVRSAARGIDVANFSVQIQERGIEIAQRRKASLDADPGAATARDFAEAEQDLLDAADARARADADLQVAILRYLLSTGQLRFDAQGGILPLQGMGPAGPP